MSGQPDQTKAGVSVETLGWEASCSCPHTEEETVPCTTLDPFCGAATVAMVSLRHGRRSIGIDLSEQYLAGNARPRIEGELRDRPDLNWLVAPE